MSKYNKNVETLEAKTILLAFGSKQLETSILKYISPKFKIIYANDGINVLKILEENQIDIAIIENKIPRISGAGCIATAKTGRAKKAPYFVLISSDLINIRKKFGPDKFILNDENFSDEIKNFFTFLK